MVVFPVCSHAAHGNICDALLQTATPSSGVPPLSSMKIQRRNGTLLAVPSVAPDGTTTESAEVIAAHTGVPVASVADRKGTDTGLLALGADPFAPTTLMVRLLPAAPAVIPRLTGMSKPYGGCAVETENTPPLRFMPQPAVVAPSV